MIEERLDELIQNLGPWEPWQVNNMGRPNIWAVEMRDHPDKGELATLLEQIARFEDGCCPRCGKPMECGDEFIDERICDECVGITLRTYLGQKMPWAIFPGKDFAYLDTLLTTDGCGEAHVTAIAQAVALYDTLVATNPHIDFADHLVLALRQHFLVLYHG